MMYVLYLREKFSQSNQRRGFVLGIVLRHTLVSFVGIDLRVEHALKQSQRYVYRSKVWYRL